MTGRAHLIAVGGIGMSALARLLCARGYRVSGSDDHLYPPASTVLAELGVEVGQGYDPARLEGAELIVVGNAVTRHNPEAAAAVARGLRLRSLPETIAEFFLAGRDPLVVAGTHGKTTSTAMLAVALRAAGREPGFFVGGVVDDLGGSADPGRGRLFVIEGDEYDSAFFDKRPKFLHYRPAALLLTAVEFDHADIYRDLDAVKDAFRRLVALLPPDAPLVVSAECEVAMEIARGGRARVIPFGFGPASQWRLEGLRDEGERLRARVLEAGRQRAELALRVPGEMNARNALGALALAAAVGVAPEVAAEALGRFGGVRRRQEVVFSHGGIVVVDDFAHHPTAVAATLGGLRLRYPGRRLRAVLEPRSNTSRRRVFQEAFAKALAVADEAVVAAVYAKPNDPLGPGERLAVDELVAALSAAGKPGRAIAAVPDICTYLVETARPGDVIVLMSNGDFGGLAGKLAAALTVKTGPAGASP